MGGKAAGHEADHSPSSSTIVKNEWNYMFSCLICLHGLYRDSTVTVSLKREGTCQTLGILYILQVESGLEVEKGTVGRLIVWLSFTLSDFQGRGLCSDKGGESMPYVTKVLGYYMVIL